jgi:hypothetical protein
LSAILLVVLFAGGPGSSLVGNYVGNPDGGFHVGAYISSIPPVVGFPTMIQGGPAVPFHLDRDETDDDDGSFSLFPDLQPQANTQHKLPAH